MGEEFGALGGRDLIWPTSAGTLSASTKLIRQRPRSEFRHWRSVSRIFIPPLLDSQRLAMSDPFKTLSSQHMHSVVFKYRDPRILVCFVPAMSFCVR